MKSIILLFCLILFSTILISQNKIQKITYEIVDTNETQFNQVKSIYNWITKNIEFDVKQLTKPYKKTPSTLRTVRKRKGICRDYCDLFVEMCEQIGIKAFTISGYCKGIDYIKGENFLCTDHHWNAFEINNEFYLGDATCGSGFLYYDWTVFKKIKRALLRREYLKTKIKFKTAPIQNLFNPLQKKIINSHYPVDAKWQFKDYPVPYTEFAHDSSAANYKYLNYKYELSKVIDLEQFYIDYTDKDNSLDYNPYNAIDKAAANYKRANNIYRSVQSIDNKAYLDDLKAAFTLYDTAQQNALKQLEIIKKEHKKLKSKYSGYKKRTIQAYRKLNKHFKLIKTPSKYTKSIENQCRKFGNEQSGSSNLKNHDNENKFNNPVPETVDYTRVQENIKRLNDSKYNIFSFQDTLLSLIVNIENQIPEEIVLEDKFNSLLKPLNNSFSISLAAINNMDFNEIIPEQNLINQQIKEISDIQLKLDSFYSVRDENYKKFSTYFEQHMLEYTKSANACIYLATLTGENIKYRNSYEELIELQTKSDKTKSKYLDILQNLHQIKISKTNDRINLLFSVKEEFDTQHGLIMSFFDFVLMKRKHWFQNYIKNANSIKNSSKQKKGQVKAQMKRIEKQK